MSLIVLGINHKTAPVEIREKVAFAPEQMAVAYQSLLENTRCSESVILSTCNRTELYCFGDDALNAEELRHWIGQFHDVPAQALDGQSYQHHDADAVRHLIRVAAGLDSMVLGEPQIFGQLKQAFGQAKHSGNISGFFDRLFQHSFATAKRIRTETDIGANAVSVAFAAVQLAKHIFADLHKNKVLLIGAGETIELVAKHLKEQHVSKILVANRTVSRAEELAQSLDAEAITLAQVPERLHEADIVISSTASQLPILGKGVVESALKRRRYKPMLLLDLAVPRDIEPQVDELGDAYLYSVDNLQKIVQQNVANREEAARQAEVILEAQVQQFIEWQRAQSSLDLLLDYRKSAEQAKQRLLERALNQLQEGAQPSQIITELASKLTNNLIHAPTQAIKQAAAADDQQALAVLRKSLGLDEQ
ncbi:glutamyl-tRNA reductase [Bowmanella sp. JS7-9]|uniref:Glutamyl-tRNA reductase n=1 Tax=Pseudobowmanella zhangzhouensis TaxID=1537679 RepID=A0ABW1XK40_9ALTE|nr:glutamyl-tRNA reductase [Bowmanella sp. JS7-9]TBX27428.1 glutamyl-tRNA reductase [Bowmanella sp. JS7-9]